MEAQENDKALRKVKVYPKFVQRSSGFIQVAEIRLSGKWLSSHGFEIGKMVEVNCEKNRIILTVR